MKYGHAIKMARTARGLTQRDLAERLGVAASYISLLEAEKRKPSVEVLESICGVLDFPMQLLVLMASTDKELRGINRDEAQAMSVHLLRIITGSEGAEGDGWE